MDQHDILRGLKDAVASWNINECRRYAELAMESGIQPEVAIEQGLAPGMECINDMFDAGTIYLPQILMASKAMEAALEIIEPHLEKNHDNRLNGIIVMGSVKGDIHSIGKNVCCAMLRGAGFRVIDLGVDVTPDMFAEAVRKHGADIVGGSALMTVSLIQQKDVVRSLKEENLSVYTIFGGAPCNQSWVDEIGGDGYSESGSEIVTLVRNLLTKQQKEQCLKE